MLPVTRRRKKNKFYYFKYSLNERKKHRKMWMPSQNTAYFFRISLSQAIVMNDKFKSYLTQFILCYNIIHLQTYFFRASRSVRHKRFYSTFGYLTFCWAFVENYSTSFEKLHWIIDNNAWGDHNLVLYSTK